MERYLCDLLVTMDCAVGETAPPIPEGAVDVGDDGRIVWCGSAADAPERPSADVCRIAGIMMPGMINAHCHTPMVLLRGAGEGLPVDRWLREVIWPREARLTPEDVRVGMRLGGAELLANGITASVEMYFSADALAEGAASVGLRCLVTPPVIEDDVFAGAGAWQKQVDEVLSLRERWSGSDLIDVGIGPHAAYSVSRRCLSRIAETASEAGLTVHIHLAEQQWEDASVRERSRGLSAPRYLESLGLLATDLIAAHCVWLDSDDIALLAAEDVAVAHCPCSNTRHASGIAPVAALQAAGVRLAIGTDGPASHQRLDLFEEMRTAMRLARVDSGDARVLTAAEALRMTTAGAAEAIGRGGDLGRLAPGCWADMVALDDSAPELHPVVGGEDDPIARIVWAGSPGIVSDVWVAGRRVVESSRVIALDAASGIAELDDRASRLSGS